MASANPKTERRHIPELSQFLTCHADQLLESNRVYCDQLVSDHKDTVREMKRYLFDHRLTSEEKQRAVESFNLVHSQLMDQFFDAVSTLTTSGKFQLAVRRDDVEIPKIIYAISIEGFFKELKDRGWNAQFRHLSAPLCSYYPVAIDVEVQLQLDI